MSRLLGRRPDLFRPRLTELEDRTVPAGNVMASVSDGILSVRGDDLANEIRIDRTGLRSAVIRPLDSTTTVNGSSDPLALGDIGYGYDIRMRGGDDVVKVGNIDRASLYIDGGDGNDIIAVEDSTLSEFAVIYGGSGSDVVTVSESWFYGRTEIGTGDGDDRVGLANTWYSTDTVLDGGSGSNFISYTGTMTPFFRPTSNFSRAFTQQLPVAVNDQATLANASSVTFDVVGNDRAAAGSINRGSIVIATQPTFGTATANADGTITYTSTQSIAGGSDSLRYYIADGSGSVSNLATVAINLSNSIVPPAPPAPTTPSATIASSSASPTTNPSVPFTVTFSEDVAGFTQALLNVTGGTISGFTATGASVYSFDVTRTAEGPIVVNVPAGAAKNSAGIANAAAAPLTVISSNIPNRNNPAVVYQSNGLGVQSVTPGTGNTVLTNSAITVNYIGWLAGNGSIFDSNTNPASPFTSPLSGLIQGWQQGLLGKRAGGIYNLFIPAALAYGSRGQGSVPPNADLVFQITLIGTTP